MRIWIELAVFILFAIPIAIFDLREYRIPDLLTLGGILVFALLKLLWDKEPIWLVAAEGAVGFSVFWLIRFVTKGKMGLGDAKFSAMIAIAAGFFFWLVAMTIASIAGLITAVVLIGRKKMTRSQRIPYAPFLSFGAAATLVLRGIPALAAVWPSWPAGPEVIAGPSLQGLLAAALVLQAPAAGPIAAAAPLVAPALQGLLAAAGVVLPGPHWQPLYHGL